MMLKEILDMLDEKIEFYENEYIKCGTQEGKAFFDYEISFLKRLKITFTPLDGGE
jgi:hypothetical protein